MRAIGAAFLLGALGCSEADPVSVDPTKAEAAIGADGGELVGTLENGFPGVKLVIPKGALADTVVVSFDGAYDETPLPALAEAVGPQVHVLPEGTPLAVPAELTVPTDPLVRLGYEDEDEDCKVWARAGDTWERKEPIATADGSVTIALEAFTTAAAGVNVVPRSPFCVGCPAPSFAVPEQPCESETGYCLTPVRDPTTSVVLPHLATVRGEDLFYPVPSPSGFEVVRFDIFGSDGGTKFSRFVTSNTMFLLRRLDASGQGTVWAPLAVKGGLVQFKTGALPKLFDAEQWVEGVAAGDTDADVTRLVLAGSAATSQIRTVKTSQMSSELMVPGTEFASFTLRKVHASGLFFAVVTGTRGGVCLGSVNRDHSTCDPDADFAALGNRRAGASAVGDDPDTGEDLAAVATPSTENVKRVTVFRLPTNALGSAVVVLRTYDLPNAVAAMAFDDDASIYAINSSRAEVMILSPDGSISTLPLTDAAVDSPEYLAKLPRAIFRIEGRNELLLLCKGTEVLRPELFRIRHQLE